MVNVVDVGKRIKNAREKAGYSVDELAEKLGVSRATVSKWVNNTSQPSLEMIDKLAKLLDVDYTELLKLERKAEQD